MRCFSKTLLVVALVGGILPRAATGQTPTAPADSAPSIPANTWVRIQVIDGGLAWQVGELGHLLPSQCVIVMVPVPGSQTGEAVTVPYSMEALRQHEIAAGCAKAGTGSNAPPGG